MLGTPGDDKFIRVFLRELYSISNHIAPQACGSRDDQCIILFHFYFFQTVYARIFFVHIFQGNELVEDSVVNH